MTDRLGPSHALEALQEASLNVIETACPFLIPVIIRAVSEGAKALDVAREIKGSGVVKPAIKETLQIYGEGLKVMGISVAASTLEAKTGDRRIHDETLDVIENPSKAIDELMSAIMWDESY